MTPIITFKHQLLIAVVLIVSAIPDGFAETRVRVGPRGYLERDGQVVFPIGTYMLPKDTTFKQVYEMGFNLISLSGNKTDWDEAYQAGLWIWHSFGSQMDFADGDIQQKKAHLQKTVEQLSGHPGLLFWESVDEPAWTDGSPATARTGPTGLSEGYRYLQSLDPHHPVYLNHAPRNTVDTLKKYNTAADIICVDIYPILPQIKMRPMYAITPEGRHGDLPNQTPSCVGEFVDKMRRVAGIGKPVFVVLQAFAWEALRDQDPDPNAIRYPSYHESRFMAYNSIIHGANGLHYWGISYVPVKHPFLADLSKVLQEIRERIPMILGEDLAYQPVLRYHERGSTIVSGIELLCKQTDDGIYIIAANTGIDPAAADFLALPPELSGADRLEVLEENRSVTIENGSFFDEFDGLDVHVYYFKKP